MADIVYPDETQDDPPDAPLAPATAAATCDACGSPLDAQDKFCPACGTPHEVALPVTAELVDAGQTSVPAAREEPEQRFFRCENCGSEVATDPEQRSYVCAFCDSTYVAEFAPDRTGRQRPEFVIGFAITPQQAQDAFYQWLRKNTWFRPGDLAAKAVADKQRGVYLPFWSFTMLAQSQWTANIGEYWYRTEVYTTTDSKGRTVTRTRRVQETEWWPLSGNHHHFYRGYLVSGSQGLPQDQADRIKPFQLPALKRYEPYFLAGWLSEEYSVERDAALQQCQQEFYRREQANVAAFLPGDAHRDVQVSTQFGSVNSDLCLLPVYVLSYRYRDKLFRFLVNGQTGKIAGDKPTSKTRIGILIGVIVALIALIVALVIIFGNN